mgnify:CR=1 FL=1
MDVSARNFLNARWSLVGRLSFVIGALLSLTKKKKTTKTVVVVVVDASMSPKVRGRTTRRAATRPYLYLLTEALKVEGHAGVLSVDKVIRVDSVTSVERQ